METVKASGMNETVRNFTSTGNPSRILLVVVIASAVLGIITGYILSNKGGGGLMGAGLTPTAKNAQSDVHTFKDFAQGVIKANPPSDDFQDSNAGTHLLIRPGGAVPVTLTSSVIDLSKYEGKKVKVFGQTQAVPNVEWFMDVGKVEEIK